MAAHPETHDRLIDSDLPCVGCGYNLRGLGLDGVCPECGVAVSRSLAGDRLAAAPAAWLNRIIRGQRLLAYGSLAAAWSLLGALVLVFIAALLSLAPSLPTFVGALFAISMIGLYLAFFGGLVCAMIGVFAVTALEPRESIREKSNSARLVTRWASAAVFMLALVCLALSSMTTVLSPRVEQLLTLAAAVGVTVATIALLSHLASLASRIPDAKLARRTQEFSKWWRWLLPAVALAVMFGPIVQRIAPPNPLSIETVIWMLIGCVSAILPLILFWQCIRFLMLLSAYRDAFDRCRARERSTSNKASNELQVNDRSV